MLYLTKTPDLVVKVNNRAGMEVEKVVKETAVNVIQKFYEFKSTKKPHHDINNNIIVKIERDWHN